MIIGWSPHTRALRNGTSSDVVRYMLDARVTEKVGRLKLELIRFPEPELLHGSATLMTKVLEGLRHKHVYSLATLSFADEDLCVDDFNLGLPERRCGSRRRSICFSTSPMPAFLPRRACSH